MSYILLVDDNKFVRTCINHILKRENFRVQDASNGLEALMILKNSTPSLIICDVRMPEMDGYNFVKALRATDTGKRIPVIMYTSIQEEKEKEKFFDLGIRHYLDKSCETDTLLQTVARAYVS